MRWSTKRNPPPLASCQSARNHLSTPIKVFSTATPSDGTRCARRCSPSRCPAKARASTTPSWRYFNHLKEEWFRIQKPGTLDEFHAGLTDDLRWWNTTRIQQRLGYLSPDEYLDQTSFIA
ncbi:IS3 family transposase [Rhodococcus erythropolis]|uniref:IS3 family transposase n=1 Tax=Rhodococcus erythropolis TaxID=1833 RepID=UPI00366D313E